MSRPLTRLETWTCCAGLGGRRLSYYGFSYGSFLGATYANLFPDRV